MTLSRSPSTPTRIRIVTISHVGSNPTFVPSSGTGPVPSEKSALSVTSSSSAYSATSNGVRLVPLVPGTRSGHGGSRMVPNRIQYRIEPSGGKNRLFSGPNPQPSPITSNSIVYSTTFSNTIGSDHHDATLVNPPIPLVADANSHPPRM